MTNSDVAALFLELADLLDLAGELPFKAISYRKVALGLNDLGQSWREVVRTGSFDKIPGTGKAIREKLTTIYETGKLPTLEKWRQHPVAAFRPMLEAFSVSPRPLGLLVKKLEASSPENLMLKLKRSEDKKLGGQAGKVAQQMLKVLMKVKRETDNA